MSRSLGSLASGPVLNDVHAGISATRVERVVPIRSTSELQAQLRQAARAGRPIAIAGRRHSMGGQPFASGATVLDVTSFSRILAFDPERWLLTAEAGATWPDVFRFLREAQRASAEPLAVAQKQTGADLLTLGGALSANAHGRGLAMRPLIGDVEEFTLVDPRGEIVRCSRSSNADLFRLAIGGYGLFGAIATVTLRLRPRARLRRVVELRRAAGLAEAFERRIAEGFLYGDFQFAIDPASPDFLDLGVFSCYRPVRAAAAPSRPHRSLSVGDWCELLRLAHVDKSEGFRRYAEHYLATDGQLYDSDEHQESTYVADYHQRLGLGHGGEVITELYVPRARLADFLAGLRAELRLRGANVIYGTVRVIERDDESMLAWAKDRYACVILNLHVEREPAALAAAAATFRALIDLALARGGSYYLTYHRYAERSQLRAAYPRWDQFAAAKSAFDPAGTCTSDWWRHYAGEGEITTAT